MASKTLLCNVLLAVVTMAPIALAETTPLADAAEQRDFDTVRKRIDEGRVDVNETQADGMTALHWAVFHDALEPATRLVAAKAKVSTTNRYGVAPLSLACLNGNRELVALLLGAGADPNTALPGGETALMTAARTGKLGPVQLLIERGADVNAREHKQQTALMWAAADGHVEVVQALIEAGADVNAKLASGFTPFFFAVREGQTGVVLKLLESGRDVNEVMRSKQNGKFSRGPLRFTPLLLAVENGHFELAEILLQQGADPNAASSGYTALHSLTWVRKPIRGDGDPPPHGSGNYTSLDMVRILAEAGADLDARLIGGRSQLGRFTYTGSTPFLLAAQASDVPLMKLLVELGADPNIPNADGCTPLLAAAGVGALGDGDESAGTEEESIAAIEYLLELGADIDAVDRNGETAMHGASYQSRADLVKVLGDHGANAAVWNCENRAGWTPLLIALGYRPGNFRPDPPTINAIEGLMRDAGIAIPSSSDLGSHQRSWQGESNRSKPWLIKDIEYARVNDVKLLLDLYLPAAQAADSPLVVWVHGGAWRSGSKQDMPLTELVREGYTVASVDYRLSPVARFPAQIHDIKAAIRFLRAHASRYAYTADRIAIAGSSAGGHLAALVGTTNGNTKLEGMVGDYLDQSSDVQAIVDLYGPTNIRTILKQSTPHGLSVRVPALDLLLGGQPEDNVELARLASPVDHVAAAAPPLLLIHGDQDPQVPINQSHELYGKYKQLGLTAHLHVVHGGAHGGPLFYDDNSLAMIQEFLEENLREPSNSATSN